MVQITIIDNRVNIKTEDIDICFEGDFEIKNTPVAGTTDATIKLDGKEIISFLEKFQNCQKANYDKPQNNQV